jgi:hypothetical protein
MSPHKEDEIVEELHGSQIVKDIRKSSSIIGK